MTYQPATDPTAIAFDLAPGAGYVVPLDPAALAFDLAVGGGRSYPVPPAIMVSSGHGILITSGQPSQASGFVYSLTPAQRAIRRTLRAASASTVINERDRSGWNRVPEKDSQIDGAPQPWGTAPVKDPGQSWESWNLVPPKDDAGAGINQAWDDSIRPIDAVELQGFAFPPAKDVYDKHEQADSSRYWEPPKTGIGAYVIGQPARFDLEAAPYIPPAGLLADFNLELAIEPTIVPTRPIFGAYDRHDWSLTTAANLRTRHPWDTKPRIGTEVDFGYIAEPNPDEPDEPDEPIEAKESYFFMNSSSLLKLPEGIPLHFSDLSITLDIDSFSWALSVSILNRESMDHIRPGPGGQVEVEATVNNKTWRFMVERYSLDQRFPRETYRVTGSSVTQLLAAPYSPPESMQLETTANALQVIQQTLDLTGFSVVWESSLVDYTIPAGAWGYDNKTPIEVVAELVKAAGGVLIPTLSLSELRAQHRYASGAPWNWAAIPASELDFQIPDSIILGLSSQWEPNPAFNAVYVAGISAGVAVDVRRDGTAGDKAAPDLYDALNLTPAQCRGRGVSILGQAGDQEVVTIEIPIPTSGAPGLVTPGQFGEIQDTRDPSQSWRGLVLETRVSVARPGASKALQTLKLERHHY